MYVILSASGGHTAKTVDGKRKNSIIKYEKCLPISTALSESEKVISFVYLEYLIQADESFQQEYNAESQYANWRRPNYRTSHVTGNRITSRKTWKILMPQKCAS